MLLLNSTRRLFLAQTAAAAVGPLTNGFVDSKLLPREQWKPFPRDWLQFPAEDRKALIATGETALKGEWTFQPATVFLEYVRTGNRSNFEHLSGLRRGRLRDLVLAECAEGKGRFADEIANGVWTTCEETFWGYPAHLSAQKERAGLPDVTEPIVDLFAAETSALLAWTDYLVGPQLDKVHKLLRPRIRLEADRRILTPALERDFGWMGFGSKNPPNNWNPWICSNWLTTSLLLERDEARRRKTVKRVMQCVDKFLAGYAPDGGCDEGPGYWFRAGASLFDCLDLMYSASGGAIDYFQMPLVAEIGRYIYRVHIAGDWAVNFADAGARIGSNGNVIYRYGKRIGDKKMQEFGAFLRSRPRGSRGRGDSISREVAAIFDPIPATVAAKAPLVRDAWFAGIQVAAARCEEGSEKGIYFAAQGGHNAESHNHNDVGNFIVFANGKPAIIDVGVENYTSKTFSGKRYEIWTMQSAWHNLPTIGGVMQGAGRQFEATQVKYTADDRAAQLDLEIAKAWPKEAGLRSWKRQLRLDRTTRELTVTDAWELSKAAPEITLTLMSAVKPVLGETVRLGDAVVHYDRAAFTASVEEVKLTDSRLKGSWGDAVWRVLLRAGKPGMSGKWVMRVTSA